MNTVINEIKIFQTVFKGKNKHVKNIQSCVSNVFFIYLFDLHFVEFKLFQSLFVENFSNMTVNYVLKPVVYFFF